ncbi:MAG TPA: hypothetical protein VMV44_01340, partial [Rectinemataceae bacterium]|nr:hypothetical protein [Rectinemataceae bacterium]
MKNKELAFRLILVGSALALVIVVIVALGVLKDPGAAPSGPLETGAATGLVFLLVSIGVVGRKAKAYGRDFVALAENPREYARALAELGAAPLQSLIVYLVLTLLYVGAVALAGTAAGMPQGDRAAETLFLVS